MRIIQDKSMTPPRPDYSVEVTSLPTRVKLSPNVPHVKAGTPLRPGTLGWEPATDGQHVTMFAVAAGYGGDEVRVGREVVLDTATVRVVPGARYTVGDIDATGYVTWKPDDNGSCTALTDHTILLTPDI